MIKFEHANLVVSDIDRTLVFLRAAFPDWDVRGKGSSDWYGKPRNWVHFGTSDNYITLNDHGEGENRDLKGHSTGLAHLGFAVDDLVSLISRLDKSGFQPHLKGEDNSFRHNAYFLDPAGFEFEFVQYFSDIAAERNLYDQ